MDQYRKWCQQGFRVIKHIVYCRCIPIDRNGISVIIPDGEGAGSAQLRYPNLWPITTRSTASTASTTLVISEETNEKEIDEMAQELASIEKLYDDLISPDKNSPER